MPNDNKVENIRIESEATMKMYPEAKDAGRVRERAREEKGKVIHTKSSKANDK